MAFDPSLWHRPVVVLSNNDGCIVAANAQAKSLNAQLQQLNQSGMAAARKGSLMFQPYLKEVLIKSLGFWASQIFSIKAFFRRRMSIRQEKITQRLDIWLSPLRAGL